MKDEIKRMYYSVGEVSEMLGMSTQSLNYWAKRIGVKRKGQVKKIVTKHYAFTPEDIEVIKIKTKRQKVA